ncbi:MAG: tetratricopeptide repeat protein [candidate division WOR-3 bacterium]
MKKFFLFFLFFIGCVYYNTFYNAEKYFEEKNYDKSIKKCKKIIERFQDSEYVDDAFFLMGKSYFYLNNLDEAKASFKQLVEYFPGSPFTDEAYLFLGKIAVEKRDKDEALLFLEKASRSPRQGIRMETFKTKLKLFLEFGEPQKAIEEGEKFVEKYSEYSGEIYYIIGNANESMGREEEALKMYKKALGKSKKEEKGKIIFSLGNLYMKMDSLEKALSVISSLGEGKLSDSLNLLKGEVLKKMNNFDESEKFLNFLSYRTDSLGAIAKYNLAEIKEIKGDTSSALFIYKEIDSKRSFGELGLRAKAKKEILEKLKLLKDLSDKEKRKELEKELKDDVMNKDSAYIFFRIGELYFWDLKEKLKGAEWYKKTYEMFPKSPYAPKAIFTLFYMNIKEDTTYFFETDRLFSILVEEFKNTQFAEKAKEIYGSYIRNKESPQ